MRILCVLVGIVHYVGLKMAEEFHPIFIFQFSRMHIFILEYFFQNRMYCLQKSR